MSKVVIFGTGDIGQLAHYNLTIASTDEVVAFSADADYINQNEYLGLPLVAFEGIVEKYPPSDFKMFVALSYSKLNEVRAQKFYEAKEKGYELISYICSKSVILGVCLRVVRWVGIWYYFWWPMGLKVGVFWGGRPLCYAA